MSEEKETGRIEAFSDGVFAVAITLLVLDIKVPTNPLTNPHASLSSELIQQWPGYLAFITSFLSILVMWINHHRIFGLIRRSNDRFLILNGLLMLIVTVVPFSTSLVAAYIRHPQAKIAGLVYAGTNFVLAIFFNLLWRYASRNGRLLASDYDELSARGLTASYRYGPHLYFIVFLTGFLSVYLCMALSMALVLFFTIPARKHAECASPSL